MSWKHHPNLRLRPHAPNRNRGRLQVQIARCFIAAEMGVRSSSQVYAWCFAYRRQHHRYSVWRILQERCEPVGRAKTIGRPILWRLRPTRDD